MARRARSTVASRWFQFTVIGVILVNAFLIGLETYPDIYEQHGTTLRVLEWSFISLFAVELTIRIAAYGPRPLDFFHDGWNIFDFTIVALVFVPGITTSLTLLRVLRVLRVVRLVGLTGDLRLLMRGLGRSLIPLAGVAVFVTFLMYVYAIVGTAMFGSEHPEQWGTAGAAMWSCFQILTLENWSELHDQAREVTPWATVYFVSFIILATMVVLNVVIAVVVSSVEQAREASIVEESTQIARDFALEAPELAERIATLRGALDELERSIVDQPPAGEAGTPATAHPDRAP